MFSSRFMLFPTLHFCFGVNKIPTFIENKSGNTKQLFLI